MICLLIVTREKKTMKVGDKLGNLEVLRSDTVNGETAPREHRYS